MAKNNFDKTKTSSDIRKLSFKASKKEKAMGSLLNHQVPWGQLFNQHARDTSLG
jgi:hypothetical protein